MFCANHKHLTQGANSLSLIVMPTMFGLAMCNGVGKSTNTSGTRLTVCKPRWKDQHLFSGNNFVL
jgi:hypothetical protein